MEIFKASKSGRVIKKINKTMAFQAKTGNNLAIRSVSFPKEEGVGKLCCHQARRACSFLVTEEF